MSWNHFSADTETHCATLLAAGSRKLGMGHLARSKGLEAALLARGWHVKRFEAADPEEAACLIEVAKTPYLILDLPFQIDGELQSARTRARVIGLDYCGEAPPHLNIAVNDPHRRLRGDKILNGFAFAIVRPDIRAARIGVGGGEGALVAIGSFDQRELGPKLARQLASLGYETTLISVQDTAAQDAVAASYHRLSQPTDFAERLARCRLAVTSGGVTMVEALHLGRAVWVAPQTKLEEQFAGLAAAEGALLGVGPTLPSAFDENAMAASAQIGAAQIDGLGVERICNAIEHAF